MDMWCDVGQVFKRVDKVKKMDILAEHIPFLVGRNRERERGKEESYQAFFR